MLPGLQTGQRHGDYILVIQVIQFFRYANLPGSGNDKGDRNVKMSGDTSKTFRIMEFSSKISANFSINFCYRQYCLPGAAPTHTSQILQSLSTGHIMSSPFRLSGRAPVGHLASKALVCDVPGYPAPFPAPVAAMSFLQLSSSHHNCVFRKASVTNLFDNSWQCVCC